MQLFGSIAQEIGRMSADLETLEQDLLDGQAKALDAWFDDQRFAEKMAQRAAEKTPSLTIMVTKGTLDWAYPPFTAPQRAPWGGRSRCFFTLLRAGPAQERPAS
jgi:hypothetical protein